MSAAPPLIRLGSLGWDPSGWQGAFYPEALPQEWRLAYYAQFFSCVLLPWPAWSAASAPTAAGWCAEVPEHFRFLLEAEGAPAPARLAPFQPRLGGVVLPGQPGGPTVLWLEQWDDPRALAVRLRALGDAGGEAYLVDRGCDLARLERAETLLELLGLRAFGGLV